MWGEIQPGLFINPSGSMCEAGKLGGELFEGGEGC